MGRAKIFLKSSEVLLGALVELVFYLRVQKKKKGQLSQLLWGKDWAVW